jgi:myo-inositol-1(or 4)-monophosphatase
MPTSDLLNLDLALHIAEGAARAAGAIIRRDYRLPRNTRDKGVNDLVTATDVASEALIVGMLRAVYPAHAINGEESGSHAGLGSHVPTWWVDPLDGTYNFVHAVPRFSVSIGLVGTDGKVLVGVVYDPMFEELYAAIRGRGATCNGEPIHVSTAPRLRDSLVASGFRGDLSTDNNNRAEWSAMVERCQGMARMGSCALDLCYVASGRFELYWEYGPTAIDRAAGTLILLEAGGRMTDVDGRRFHAVDSPSILASNSLIHDEALAVLADAKRSIGV